MKLDVTNKFLENLSLLPIEIQIKTSEVVEELEIIKDSKQLKSQALIGFPYFHKIEIENFSLCFYLGKEEIELLGIVENGKELMLIF